MTQYLTTTTYVQISNFRPGFGRFRPEEGPIVVQMMPQAPKSISSWQGGLIASGSVFGFWMVLSWLGFTAPPELTWDEGFMLPVVEQLADRWPEPSVFWDFEDTKGPGFFVPAAILFDAGVGLEGLRLINLMLAICSAGLIGMLVKKNWCAAAAVGLLLALMPYHAVLSHLFMSETSFVLGSIILGILATAGPKGEPGIWRPLAFGLGLAILLHHRVHAVVPAAAAVLVAFQRDGSPAWRYGLAGLAAGILRLPLYLEWGGLVSPEYANRYGMGFSPEAVVYLLGAVAPLVWVGVPLGWSKRPTLMAWVGVLTVMIALVAGPDLASPDGGVRPDGTFPLRFQGLLATAVLKLPLSIQPFALTLSVAMGTMGLTGLYLQLPKPGLDENDGFPRYGWYLLAFGCLLYVATRGAVYDRYLLCFGCGLPILLVRHAPGWSVAGQGCFWLLLTLWSASNWLLPTS